MRQSAFEILGVYADSTAEEIKAAYKEKMRAILDGSSKMTESDLNSAYNEVKTDERRNKYTRRNPWAKYKTKPSEEAGKTKEIIGGFYTTLDSRGVPTDLVFMTAKDRRNLERG